MNARARFVLNASFVLTGAITTLLGPWLPYFLANRALSDAAAGRLFFVQFVFSTAGAALLGPLGRRWRIERCLAFAYLVMGCGVIALGFTGAALAPVAVACYGFGIGISNPAASMVAARGSAGRETAALNLLNMMWSAGAVLAPAALAYLFALGRPPLVLLGLGSLTLAASAALIGLRAAGKERASAPSVATAPTSARALAWMTAVFLFLYVGAESTLSGWLPTYASRHFGIEPRMAGFAPSAFWAAILAGRFVASVRSCWTTPAGWIFRGLSVAMIGMAVLILARWPAFVFAAAVLAGAGMAPLFPTMIAIFQRRTGAAGAPLIGYIFAVSGFGGAVLPWLVGVLSSAIGSLRVALLTALVAAAGMWLTARYCCRERAA